MATTIETVIIGAGQAGLSTSYHLTRHGREHIILEQAERPGDVWHSQRWDSFTFVSPNWSFQIPGGEYDGPDPDGFMHRDELVRRFAAYAEAHRLPISYNTRVTSVRAENDTTFILQTDGQEYRARNVVTANGWFHTGKIPPFAASIPPSILQMHSNRYRNPPSLPPGAVLLVGSGQSSAQIAEDLVQGGRRVYLTTGSAFHLPRRYRGMDIFKWIIGSGFAEQTFDQILAQGSRSFVAPILTGRDGGHDLSLHHLARAGVTLLGRAVDYAGGRLILAPDLRENLHRAGESSKKILGIFDEYVRRSGMDAPVEELPDLRDGFAAEEIPSLDLQDKGIQTVIWACGFRYDPSIFTFPVLDAYGLPDAPDGESRTHPGLYFAGFPFTPALKTGFIFGIAPVVESIAGRIAAHQP